jgi:3-hydroxymyristoyl/3-hydroxydecanoyl-(acyl carrier protein) dehydratase
MWHILSEINEINKSDFSATAKTGEKSLWFDGHFDDKPILPGIAQTAMVFEAIKNHESFKDHPEIKIKTIRRVRFRRLISPDEEINISIKKNTESPDTYNFKIHVKDELACSGIVETNI